MSDWLSLLGKTIIVTEARQELGKQSSKSYCKMEQMLLMVI